MSPNRGASIALALALAAAPASFSQEALILTVVPFKTQADAAFAYIGESFSETLTTKLVGVRGIKLYERSQFARVADELKLESSSTDFFDQDTVSRVGKVVSIDYMLLGSATLAGGQLSCSVRLVNVTSGRAMLAQEFRGNYPNDLFDLQDRAALAVAKALELRLSEFDLRSLARKPTTDMDAFGLYNSCLASKDVKQRIALLEKAVARDPGFTQALNLLADLYEEAGRTIDARDTYAKILAADPDDYRATYNLALLKLDEGDAKRSAELLSRCVEMKGEDPDALYHLGLGCEFGDSGRRFDAGADLASARRFYERACAADPKHAEAIYALGVVCASLAQASSDPAEQLALVRESLDSLRAYLDVNPDCQNRDEIEENVQLLEGSEKGLVDYLGAGSGSGSP
jgi:TolB-like protein